ncbi:hypothetical protein N7456_003836 [Penicillium angulare]|uniref:Uncharacterized protein n=1 Tax=Penicillium angulare TaxID=116970 RepID=A0A9W9KIM4_9EURO|nr:hypothetical protein N7456_003836 [Penicillium angulare]
MNLTDGSKASYMIHGACGHVEEVASYRALGTLPKLQLLSLRLHIKEKYADGIKYPENDFEDDPEEDPEEDSEEDSEDDSENEVEDYTQPESEVETDEDIFEALSKETYINPQPCH